MLSAGAAFLLAYQPASLVIQLTRRALVDQVAADAAGGVPELAHAVTFARGALAIEDRLVATATTALADQARGGGVIVPALPTDLDQVSDWIDALRAAARGQLAGPLAVAAYAAGEAARDLHVASTYAAQVVYLRIAAPAHAALQAEAAALPGGVVASLNEVERAVAQADQRGLDAAMADLRERFRGVPDLATAVAGADFQATTAWARRLDEGLQALGRAFATLAAA